MHFDRRALLVSAGSIALAGPAPIAFAQSMTTDPFTLGVAAGDPWPDGFVIWTRLAPRPLELGHGLTDVSIPVQFEVATDSNFSRLVRSGEALATAQDGHSVHVELSGLEPARPYWYRFRVGRHVSRVGMARTAPAAGARASTIRIGVAGCQNYEHGHFTAYRYMAEEQLDAIFHYGDYIYEGRQGRRSEIAMAREHLGPEPETTEQYRLRYAQYKLDPDLQAAHAACAFLMTYDDHEVDNNWAGDRDESGTDPSKFLIRRFAAMRAWYENMPVRRDQKPTPTGIQMFRRLDYGKLLRVHLLDTRQYRDDQICTDVGQRHCREASGWSQGSILGNRQQVWLEDGLDASFGWNLMAQQVVVMPYDLKEAAEKQEAITADSWIGYPKSRAGLVEAIRRKGIPNAVIATGDVHQNIVGYVPMRDDEPDGPPAAVEFVCTSISSLGDGRDIKVRGPDFRRIIARNPNVHFANGQRGYQVFEVNEREWQTRIMKVDKVSDKSGVLSRLAGFTLERDSPMVIPS